MFLDINTFLIAMRLFFHFHEKVIQLLVYPLHNINVPEATFRKRNTVF